MRGGVDTKVGARLVLRGGSWINYPQLLRSAHRYYITPSSRFYHSGFRLARITNTATATSQRGDLQMPKHEFIPIKAPFGDFEIGADLVTVDDYAEFLRAHPEYEKPTDWENQQKSPRNPVVYVSWHDAEAYAKWTGARLPAEQEWEWVATNGGKTTRPWGDEEATSQHKAESLTPIRSELGNVTPNGVWDLVGKVWQWVA